MWACSIRRFATALDEVVVRMAGDRCICLLCFDRETGGAHPMPNALRLALTAALGASAAT